MVRFSQKFQMNKFLYRSRSDGMAEGVFLLFFFSGSEQDHDFSKPERFFMSLGDRKDRDFFPDK